LDNRYCRVVERTMYRAKRMLAPVRRTPSLRRSVMPFFSSSGRMPLSTSAPRAASRGIRSTTPKKTAIAAVVEISLVPLGVCGKGRDKDEAEDAR